MRLGESFSGKLCDFGDVGTIALDHYVGFGIVSGKDYQPLIPFSWRVSPRGKNMDKQK